MFGGVATAHVWQLSSLISRGQHYEREVPLDVLSTVVWKESATYYRSWPRLPVKELLNVATLAAPKSPKSCSLT